MPKPGYISSLLVTIFWLCLSVSFQAQPGKAKAGTAMVSGFVTLKGEPARGVTVILHAQNQNASNAVRARTDESGHFYFTGLLAGKYSISALAPGYVSPDELSFPGLRGRALPAGHRFIAMARRLEQSGPNMRMADIDARGQFIIENLSPGGMRSESSRNSSRNASG